MASENGTNAKIVIWINDMHKVYKMGENEVHALRGVSLGVQPGRDCGDHGAVRLREIHADEHPGLPRSADVGTVHARRQGREQDERRRSGRRCAIARSASSSRASTCCRAPSALDNVDAAPRLRRNQRQRAPRTRQRGVGGRGTGRSDAPHAQRAFRRTTAARRHRPRAGQRTRHHPRRRANRQPGQHLRRGSDGASSNSSTASRASPSSWSRTTRASGITRSASSTCSTAKSLNEEIVAEPIQAAVWLQPRRPRHEASGRACVWRSKRSTANKLRAALTMLGIIIGVGAVITLMSAGEGVQAYITKQFQSIGSNLFFVIPGSFEQELQPPGLPDAERRRSPAQRAPKRRTSCASRRLFRAPRGSPRPERTELSTSTASPRITPAVRDWATQHRRLHHPGRQPRAGARRRLGQEDRRLLLPRHARSQAGRSSASTACRSASSA